MKKLLLPLLMLVPIIAAHSLNIDYGASIDSFTGGSLSDNSYLFGFEKASLYSSFQFNEKISFTVDGFYKYSFNTSTPIDNGGIFDLSTFLLGFSVGSIDLQVGRNFFGDYSGDILSHTLDGVSFSMPLSFATLYGNIGFTGLVNDKEVSLFKSIQDGEDNIKRVIEGVDLVKDMESLSVWASLYGYQDMGSLITNSPYYIGAGVKGSLLSDIYYTVRGNFKTGVSPYTKTGEETVESALILAGMGAFSIDWYMNIDKDIIRMLTPSMSLNIGISSGDSDLDDVQLGSNSDEALESISLYSPMGASGPGVVYSTSNQNLLYIKYVGSVAPFKTLQVQLESALFMRTVSGVSGNSDVMSDATGNYLGTEVSVSANYRPFSDLGISVSGGMFIPNKDVMTSGDPTGMLTAYVSLSL